VDHEVPADREEVREHDLGDRPQARHGRAHRGAENGLFGDGRVDDALGPELVKEADGRLEHASGTGDVLTDEDHPVVASHLLPDAARDRIAIRQCRHDEPPSAQTSVSALAGGGSSPAIASSVARSTASATSLSMTSSSAFCTPSRSSRSRYKVTGS